MAPPPPAPCLVVGNPKPASRTRTAGEAVLAGLAEPLGLAERVDVIELAELGPELFDWGSSSVADAVARVQASPLVVVASPVYKACFTGLVKSFLDWFGAGSLSDVVAVPMMVGAAPNHALAVEAHLRPVLVELGAPMPTRGLFLLESQLEDLDSVLAPWLDVSVPQLRRSLGASS